jgi:trans-2,3-dihydro-3-hydroxyanthranilate isomerase
VSGLAVHWLDVFTDRPFAGNPVAVLPDADDLSDEQMQTIAAELGLSETVFVRGGAERLRIFTPGGELPLAGHPVVGTSLCLARLGRIPSDGRHVFRTGVGETPVEVHGGVATMTQAPLEVGDEADPERVAAMLGIDAGDLIGGPRFHSTTGDWSQLFVQLRDRVTLGRVAPDLPLILAEAATDSLVAWCEHGDELAQRVFLPRLGIPEDPATGAAAGAVGALRVFEGGAPGDVVVRQGDEVGRPSEIHVSVGGSPGAPEPPRVGGRAVSVLEGTLHV